MGFLSEPSLIGVPVGSVEYFHIQRRLISERPLLASCYSTWYQALQKDAQSVPGGAAMGTQQWVELGSGGSSLIEYIPNLITSDVVEGVASRVIDGRSLPFANSSVDGLFLTHSFHHIPNVEMFLGEAVRVLKSGGVVALVEVANTLLARLLFSNFHPEPFLPNVKTWDFDQKDSMMDSNQALSWVVFFRDRELLHKKFPELEIEVVEYLPWFSYLVAGGVTKKNLIPRSLSLIILKLDKIFQMFAPLCALHWHIRIRRK